MYPAFNLIRACLSWLVRGKKPRSQMVGTGRFELPTPHTPSECSTRLSHVPTRTSSSYECIPAPHRWSWRYRALRTMLHSGQRAAGGGPWLPRLFGWRHVVLREPGALTEEVMLHLLHQKLLRLRRPRLQTVFVRPRLSLKRCCRSCGRSRCQTAARPTPPSPACCVRKKPCVPSCVSILYSYCRGSATPTPRRHPAGSWRSLQALVASVAGHQWLIGTNW
jgi:hypothetical protein